MGEPFQSHDRDSSVGNSGTLTAVAPSAAFQSHDRDSSVGNPAPHSFCKSACQVSIS